MHHLKSAPPLAPLLEVVRRLEDVGLVIALGGSGLLAALGLAETVRDWDLTSDEPFERLATALAGMPVDACGPDDLHADRKLVLAGGTVELIVGLAFHVPGGVVRLPTAVSGHWHGVPLGSPEGWAVAYHLLGRPEKSEALLAHLDRTGASSRRVMRLLAEPLPPALAARLAALPTSSGT